MVDMFTLLLRGYPVRFLQKGERGDREDSCIKYFGKGFLFHFIYRHLHLSFLHLSMDDV